MFHFLRTLLRLSPRRAKRPTCRAGFGFTRYSGIH